MKVLRLINKQEGSALVMVMITFMVLALLGTATIAISSGEVRQSVALDKDMRAYYKARSAADVTMKWIETQIDDLNKEADDLETIRDDDDYADALAVYEAHVAEFEMIVPPEGDTRISTATHDNITGIDDVDKIEVYRQGNYIIAAGTATVHGMSATARVRLEQDSTRQVDIPWTEEMSFGLFQEAIYAKEDLTFNGNSNIVLGDVRYEGDLTNRTPNTPGYSCSQNLTSRTYPDWDPPAGLESKTWSNTINPDNNGEYDNLTFTRSTTLNIDTHYYDPVDEETKEKDVILYIKNLDVQQSLTIKATGTAKVFLFIDNLTFTGGNANMAVETSTTNDPNLYLIFDQNASDVEFKLAGNDKFQCYVYAPTVNITFSGTPDICGAVIAKDFRSNGNLNFTYNPPDPLENGEFNGEDGTINQTVNHEIKYTRLGAAGGNGKQWLAEGR